MCNLDYIQEIDPGPVEVYIWVSYSDSGCHAYYREFKFFSEISNLCTALGGIPAEPKTLADLDDIKSAIPGNK